jgi:hypothetical protein
LSTSALCSHGDNIRTTSDKDTRVLHQFSVLDEELTAMNIDDLSLPVLSTMFFDCIIVSNLGAVPICCNCSVVAANIARDLSMQEGTDVSLLIEDT